MTDNEHADQEAHNIELDEAVQHAEDADHFTDQPPVDDFEDEASASVEEHGDEESHHEESAEGEVEPQPSKSGKVIFLGVIAGVIILVGGIVYTQFFAGGSAPAPMRTAQPGNTQVADIKPVVTPPGAVVTPPANTNAVTPKADDISSLKQLETAQTENQQVALTGVQGDKAVDVMSSHANDSALTPGVSGNQQMKGVASIPALPPSATPSTLPPSLATPDAPAAIVPATAAPAANSTPTAPAVPVIPNIPVTAASAVVPVVPAKPTLVAPPTANAALPGMTSAVPVSLPASPVVVDKDAQVRIATLTAQVATLQQSLDQALDKLNHVSATVTPAGEPPLKAGAVSVTTAYSDSTAVHPHHTTAHKAVAHPRTALAKAAHKQAVAKTAAVKAPHWVLRAAVPGEAWIATSADTPDLRHVKVGDSVTGLGQITAITSTGMGWIVQGTLGSAE